MLGWEETEEPACTCPLWIWVKDPDITRGVSELAEVELGCVSGGLSGSAAPQPHWPVESHCDLP